MYRPAEDSYLLLRAVTPVAGTPFLEIGAGTGLIALHAAAATDAVATDVNPFAVRLLRGNARRNERPLTVLRTDLFRGLRGRFATVVFNPPYLPVRPRDEWLDRAWAGGPDGDAVILAFLHQLRNHLAPHGRAYLLLSSHNDAARRRAEDLYVARQVAAERLFFERLAVWELRVR